MMCNKIRLWLFIKKRFTKLVVFFGFHEVVDRVLRNIHSLIKIELQFQFRHLLPQLGVPHLLEDVVGKDTNACQKCYGDRGVPNSILISC